MKKKPAKQQMNLMKLFQDFDTSEECRTYLEELRWPDGVKCPRCQSGKISRIRERNQFDCDSCRYQFSVTAGSIFHDSHLPLPKWFAAVYLMCEARKGVSANQLKRTLSVSYKTAWYLCHRIRKAMEELNPAPLKGTVEIDEAYIGGKRRHVGGGYRGNKTMVLGAIERGGEVRLKIEKRNNKPTLHRFVAETTAPETERIMTDEWRAYRGIGDADTKHETVDHYKEEWVRGDVHTNSIEGVWSLFKRSVIGSYHQVSAKHLDRYLDEFEFRFNNRKNPYLFRDTLLKLLQAQALTYQKLTA
ncbi:MAG TPA: IS1595 family transposase [Thermoanaerobaculia bacterium]|jgi:transposase-like protein|nr:IS1595 family transposase [Thermoanaerobaculia bacterium]